MFYNVIPLNLAVTSLPRPLVPSLAVHVQEKKKRKGRREGRRRGDKRREEKKRGFEVLPSSLPSLLSSFPFFPNRLGIFSISSFWSQSLVPLAVLDGHITFGVDGHGKRVVVAGIAVR
jgi:hypothetical protein